jgi:hypothetical protein
MLLVCVLLAPATRLSAAPILIDFEGIADLTSVDSLIPGVTFTNGTVLQSGAVGGSLNEIDFPPVSGTGVVFDGGGPVRIDFAAPIDLFSGYFTYVAPLSIQAFDAGNGLLGTVSASSANNLGAPNELLSFALAGISSVIITGDPLGGSFTLDDVSYQTQATDVTVVPEPGTVLLLGTGLAVLARKRQRARQSRVAPHLV